jgi:hypothetical protein
MKLASLKEVKIDLWTAKSCFLGRLKNKEAKSPERVLEAKLALADLVIIETELDEIIWHFESLVLLVNPKLHNTDKYKELIRNREPSDTDKKDILWHLEELNPMSMELKLFIVKNAMVQKKLNKVFHSLFKDVEFGKVMSNGEIKPMTKKDVKHSESLEDLKNERISFEVNNYDVMIELMQNIVDSDIESIASIIEHGILMETGVN